MLTPLDIENKRFSKKRVNGYSPEEVDDFLEEVALDYTKQTKELLDANKKIEELNASMQKYRTIEDTLQNTLIMAQTTADEVKKVAKQQAEQIINEAKTSVQKESDSLEQQIIYKRKDLEDIKKQFDIYKAKMESLLISQLELLKDVNKDENV